MRVLRRSSSPAECRVWAALAVCVLFTATACGTRVPHDEALRIAMGASSRAAGAAAGLAAGDSGSSTGGAGAADGSASGAAAAGASANAGGGVASGTGAAGASSASGRGAAAGSAGKQAPIVIGMDGDFSGIAGSNTGAARDAFAAWVKLVNDRGGINGHSITLYTADNGGDPAKSMATIRDFVENRHVIALANLFPAGNDAAIGQYAWSKHVPVVGGWAIDPSWNQLPALFPAVSSYDAGNFSWAQAMANAGAKKVGSVYCSEGAVCKNREQAWARYAKGLGLQVVYEAGASLAQPDYTAECLQARSAGAEAVLPEMDGNSVTRFAQSCKRQGYSPIIINPAPTNTVVPEMEGMIAALPSFPWFLTSGSPTLDEYGAALSKYVSGSQTTVYSSLGWIDGKLLEKALAHVSDIPTSDDIFKGLWAMQGETLGGLTPPLTFVQGKPAPENKCSYTAQVRGQKWTAPVGMQPNLCKP